MYRGLPWQEVHSESNSVNNSEGCPPAGSAGRVPGRAAFGLIISFWLLACGCSVFSAVPVTLKEVKDYAVGSQESFSYPLDEVMKATTVNLKATGFTLIKIEKTSPKGFIRADWQATSVKLYLESVTPRLTTVRSKVRRQGGVADLASEDELFEQVHDTLDRGGQITWERLTGGMVRVYAEPDTGAAVVGILWQRRADRPDRGDRGVGQGGVGRRRPRLCSAVLPQPASPNRGPLTGISRFMIETDSRTTLARPFVSTAGCRLLLFLQAVIVRSVQMHLLNR